MTTTTAETLTVGTTVLNTLGYNIDLWTSTTGSHTREPRHILLPRRAGAIRLDPAILPTTLELSMWVSNRDPDGVPNGTQQMWDNLDTILGEVGSLGEVKLTKVRNSAPGSLITLDMDVELVGPVEWNQIGPEAIQLTVPMIAAYPFWNGAAEDEPVTGSGTMTNPGHSSAQNVTITLEAAGAPWVNPSVENTTTGRTIDFAGTVTANDTYTINFWDGTALDDGGASIAGQVTVNGTFWPLDPGGNSISVTQTSGSGTVRAVFDPPYLG